MIHISLLKMLWKSSQSRHRMRQYCCMRMASQMSTSLGWWVGLYPWQPKTKSNLASVKLRYRLESSSFIKVILSPANICSITNLPRQTHYKLQSHKKITILVRWQGSKYYISNADLLGMVSKYMYKKSGKFHWGMPTKKKNGWIRDFVRPWVGGVNSPD